MSHSRTFTPADQEDFAILSGDYNPMHLDPLIARRTLFGKPVVHGVHVVLWVLDAYLLDTGLAQTKSLKSLKATFTKPVGVGETATWVVQREKIDQVDFVVMVEDTPMIKIKSGWALDPLAPEPMPLPSTQTSITPPQPREQDELFDAKGELRLWLDIDHAHARFAALTQQLAPLQFAELLALTRLVGMECPGLNSVFSEFDIAFALHHKDQTDAPTSNLSYTVAQYDERFNRVLMRITAPMLSGNIRAFVRPPIHTQPSYAQVLAYLKKISNPQVSSPQPFSNQRALVVGGSRGLGEVMAKLLAAGGADVRLTYHRGAQEAQRIVDDIHSGGGLAQHFALDVLQPDAAIVALIASGWAPTHLYYLATPFIFDATSGIFSPRLFRQFCDYYVFGFLSLLNLLKPHGLRAVFYPSSVALDTIPANMGEYAAAKAAGEMLCAFVEQHSRDLHIYRPRLPRLATDQTASLLPVDNGDPVSVMFANLCHLCL